MKNLNLTERNELREKFVSEYFDTKSSAAHTKNTLGRVLEDYEKVLKQYIEEKESSDSIEELSSSPVYYLLTLQLGDLVEYHSIKCTEGVLPHVVMDNSKEVKDGVRIINYNTISKEEYDNSSIYQILPPEMSDFREE